MLTEHSERMRRGDRKYDKFLKFCHRISDNDPTITSIGLTEWGFKVGHVDLYMDTCCKSISIDGKQQGDSAYENDGLEKLSHFLTALVKNTTIQELEFNLKIVPHLRKLILGVSKDPSNNTTSESIWGSNLHSFFRNNPSLRKLHILIPHKQVSYREYLPRQHLTPEMWYHYQEGFFEQIQDSFANRRTAGSAHATTKTDDASSCSCCLDEIKLTYCDWSESARDKQRMLSIANFLSTCPVNKVSFVGEHLKTQNLLVLATKGILLNPRITHVSLERINQYEENSKNELRPFLDALINHPIVKTVEWTRKDTPDFTKGWKQWIGMPYPRSNLLENTKTKAPTPSKIDKENNNMIGSNDNTKNAITCSGSTTATVTPTKITFAATCTDPFKSVQIHSGTSWFENIQQSNMSSLVSFVTATACQSLQLDHVNLSTVSHLLVSLLEQAPPTLRRLSLIGNKLQCSDGTAIAEALTKNPSCQIESIDISNNAMIEDSIAAATAWKNYLTTTTTLKNLEYTISGSTLKSIQGLRIVWESLHSNRSLESLSIVNQSICINSGSLNKSKKWSLKAVQVLADVLQNNSQSRLMHLTLRGLIRFKDSDWVVLARALSNNATLQTLELQQVGIGNRTLKALAESLTNNTTLHKVDISHNDNITQNGVHSFVHRIPHLHGLHFFGLLLDGYPDTCNSTKHDTLRRRLYKDTLSSTERWYLDVHRSGRSVFLERTAICTTLWPRLVERLAAKRRQNHSNGSCNNQRRKISSTTSISTAIADGAEPITMQYCDTKELNKELSSFDILYDLFRQNADILASVRPANVKPKPADVFATLGSPNVELKQIAMPTTSDSLFHCLWNNFTSFVLQNHTEIDSSNQRFLTQ